MRSKDVIVEFVTWTVSISVNHPTAIAVFLAVAATSALFRTSYIINSSRRRQTPTGPLLWAGAYTASLLAVITGNTGALRLATYGWLFLIMSAAVLGMIIGLLWLVEKLERPEPVRLRQNDWID